ncbi:MAG: GIY-YIG nuclease family protein [Candidatus Omnitrophica bacterium]|nr:GIY-YIG nuclease family protein [Candidatus Omnitrophota bacterium]
MYYLYILQCADGMKYYGHTNNLTQRLYRHSKGQVLSTKDRRPLELVYYEEFDSRSKALRRERQFKGGKTRKRTIERMINLFSKSVYVSP